MSGLLKKCLLRRNVAARVCRNLVQISLGVSRRLAMSGWDRVDVHGWVRDR